MNEYQRMKRQQLENCKAFGVERLRLTAVNCGHDKGRVKALGWWIKTDEWINSPRFDTERQLKRWVKKTIGPRSPGTRMIWKGC